MSAVNTDITAQIRPNDNGELVIIQDGVLQLDNYYGRTKVTGENQHSVSSLVRYGLSKNYEFQFGWSASKINTSTESANIGLKVYLTENSKYIPELTAIFSTTLTIDPSNIPFQPSINLLFEKPITDTWRTNGNFQLSFDELGKQLSHNYSGNIEADVTDWQTTYLGLTGNYNPYAIDGSQYQHYVEIGMLIWIHDGITLYPFYDIGLNDISEDIFNIGALFTLGR